MPARGGIKGRNTAPVVRDALAASVSAPGSRAIGVLRLASNVADTETVSIGNDVYEVETVATATGATTGAAGAFNNTTNPLDAEASAAHGLADGDVIAIDTEIMKVIKVISVTRAIYARGRAGTAIAQHGNAVGIFKGNGITAGRIPVGFIATFTPAVAGPAFAAEINNALAGGVRCRDKVPVNFPAINAVSLAAGAELLVYSVTPEVRTTALAETLAGANNAWNAAAMKGGAVAAALAIQRISRVPDANEVTIGNMRFAFPFVPTFVTVDVIITASGIAKGWVGGWAIAAVAAPGTGAVVTVDNAGATDWAATDTVYVTAYQ